MTASEALETVNEALESLDVTPDQLEAWKKARKTKPLKIPANEIRWAAEQIDKCLSDDDSNAPPKPLREDALSLAG